VAAKRKNHKINNHGLGSQRRNFQTMMLIDPILRVEKCANESVGQARLLTSRAGDTKSSRVVFDQKILCENP
jgi:hypothetical protein